MNYIILNQVGFLLQIYEPVLYYIKMIDMVKGEGGQRKIGAWATF